MSIRRRDRAKEHGAFATPNGRPGSPMMRRPGWGQGHAAARLASRPSLDPDPVTRRERQRRGTHPTRKTMLIMSRRYRNSSVKRVVELEKGCTARPSLAFAPVSRPCRKLLAIHIFFVPAPVRSKCDYVVLIWQCCLGGASV
jgi:hypothetical protein